MNWLTIIWAAGLGACLTLALLHFSIWWRNRKTWAQLSFFVTTLGITGLAFCEMGCNKATTAEAYANCVRLAHVATGVLTLGCVAFVHFYFGTSTLWLLYATLGIRAVAVLLNFTTGSSLHFQSVGSLDHMIFLGEMVTVPGKVVEGPLMFMGPLAAFTFLIYVIDASVRLWRKGPGDGRQRAVVVGGALACFLILAPIQAALVTTGVVRMPFLVSFPFMGMALAMGIELSRDALNAARTSAELRKYKERLTLAATAARLVLWEWNISADRIWISEGSRARSGEPQRELATLAEFEATVHPEDRPRVHAALQRAINGGEPYTVEYRVLQPDGNTRWSTAVGRVERDDKDQPVLLRGVSMDVSPRKRAEEESARQRNELAHLSRVATLGELSGSLAHELNQPLAIMLSNAQAAQRLLARDVPDLAEIRDILADIVAEDRRAGEVIKKLRALFKHGEAKLQNINLEEVTCDMLAVLHSDLIERGVRVQRTIPHDLPQVTADVVQIQQVVLNLMLNACDAMAANPPANRTLKLGAIDLGGIVRLSVADCGCGLPPGNEERIFEPFFSTKPEGLGMGLAICRSIAVAHGGRLVAAPIAEGGTVFYLDLPVAGARSS